MSSINSVTAVAANQQNLQSSIGSPDFDFNNFIACTSGGAIVPGDIFFIKTLLNEYASEHRMTNPFGPPPIPPSIEASLKVLEEQTNNFSPDPNLIKTNLENIGRLISPSILLNASKTIATQMMQALKSGNLGYTELQTMAEEAQAIGLSDNASCDGPFTQLGDYLEDAYPLQTDFSRGISILQQAQQYLNS